MNLQRPAGEEEMGPCKRPSKTVYRVFGAQMYDDGRSLMSMSEVRRSLASLHLTKSFDA